MMNAQVLASRAIDRAKNLGEYIVFRPMTDIVFDGEPMPYTMSHVMGMPVEITVPAISQAEAEQRVDAWLQNKRDHNE
jgi:hypothetical protein